VCIKKDSVERPRFLLTLRQHNDVLFGSDTGPVVCLQTEHFSRLRPMWTLLNCFMLYGI
jgi:hypothetical protein